MQVTMLKSVDDLSWEQNKFTLPEQTPSWLITGASKVHVPTLGNQNSALIIQKIWCMHNQ